MEIGQPAQPCGFSDNLLVPSKRHKPWRKTNPQVSSPAKKPRKMTDKMLLMGDMFNHIFKYYEVKLNGPFHKVDVGDFELYLSGGDVLLEAGSGSLEASFFQLHPHHFSSFLCKCFYHSSLSKAHIKYTGTFPLQGGSPPLYVWDDMMASNKIYLLKLKVKVPVVGKSHLSCL